ncbi:MAG: hypothetical protein WKF65_08710 [Gaiellaceae bacterium]
MTNSAIRRNAASLFGIASAADIKARRYMPTSEDAERVSSWIRSCQIAWIECDAPEAAAALETQVKLEEKPPLTKV